jgi:PAS domain S-box-containing protein/excisionase family DNA binding protein
MAEAARLKGVSYHTVSRAIRRGKLPVQRLGRMALVAAEDLRAWEPMRERAPRKYRRREPNPDVAPALLDLASAERVDLARRLSTLYEVLHSAADQLPLPEFLNLLCDRLGRELDFRRVEIRGIDGDGRGVVRLAAYGAPFAELPDRVGVAEVAAFGHFLALDEATVIPDVATTGGTNTAALLPGVTALFGAPLRAGGRLLGFVFGDCAGEPVHLSEDQLGLAQVLAHQAALALERAQLRDAEGARRGQLAAVLDDLGEAVHACDRTGRLTLSNAADRRLLGLEPDAPVEGQDARIVLGRIEFREFDGSPLPVEELPLFRALAGEPVNDRRYRVVRPGDGSERMVSVSARPLLDERDGTIVGAVSVARDITVERQAALQAANRLAELAAAADRAAAVADLSLAVNAGADLSEMMRTAVDRLAELLDATSATIFFREANGQMVGQAGYRFDPSAETLVLDPIGVPSTMVAFARRAPLHITYEEASTSERALFDRYGFRSCTIAPLIVHGELIGVAYVNYATDAYRPTPDDLAFAAALANQCAVAIDKTRLMARSEAAHRRLLTVVDQLPQGVVIAGAPGGQIVLANRAAEALWGMSPDALTAQGGPVGDADGVPFPAGDGPLERTLRTGEQRLGEALTVLRPDGEVVTVVANHAPIIDADGAIVGAVGVLQDAAQLRAIDQAKDEFLSIVAHELRNPLTSLRGNLQLLLRRVRREADPSRADEAERLEAVIAQSDRMGELVNRLLDVSRVDLGRLDLSVGPSDAAAAVRRAVEAARGLSKAHRFVAEVPDEFPVVWDGVRIEQVLSNLLDNAVKYTDGGEVRVRLRSGQEGRLVIVVEDQGPGIPDTVKARLFERYYRAPLAATAADGRTPGGLEGMGIGLYISHKIVAAHDGRLSVEDAVGGGARFVIELPGEASVTTPEPRSQPPSTPIGSAIPA